jgi:D-sedoheptulose 7-phosphate isomerase
VILRTFAEIAAEHEEALRACAEAFSRTFPEALQICTSALEAGRKLLICGNGGSAADAQHFAAELVGRFEQERRPLPAVSLSTDASVMTALANDFGFHTCFSRQVEALGNPGDVLVAVSTSGNSENVLCAAEAAGALGIKRIGLTGAGGGKLSRLVDVCFDVPSRRTARVQEIHAICLHAMAEAIEQKLCR